MYIFKKQQYMDTADVLNAMMSHDIINLGRCILATRHFPDAKVNSAIIHDLCKKMLSLVKEIFGMGIIGKFRGVTVDQSNNEHIKRDANPYEMKLIQEMELQLLYALGIPPELLELDKTIGKIVPVDRDLPDKIKMFKREMRVREDCLRIREIKSDYDICTRVNKEGNIVYDMGNEIEVFHVMSREEFEDYKKFIEEYNATHQEDAHLEIKKNKRSIVNEETGAYIFNIEDSSYEKYLQLRNKTKNVEINNTDPKREARDKERKETEKTDEFKILLHEARVLFAKFTTLDSTGETKLANADIKEMLHISGYNMEILNDVFNKLNKLAPEYANTIDFAKYAVDITKIATAEYNAIHKPEQTESINNEHNSEKVRKSKYTPEQTKLFYSVKSLFSNYNLTNKDIALIIKASGDNYDICKRVSEIIINKELTGKKINNVSSYACSVARNIQNDKVTQTVDVNTTSDEKLKEAFALSSEDIIRHKEKEAKLSDNIEENVNLNNIDISIG